MGKVIWVVLKILGRNACCSRCRYYQEILNSQFIHG